MAASSFTPGSSLVIPPLACPQNLNQRVLFPPTSTQCRQHSKAGNRLKRLIFCPKATALRSNVAPATGVVIPVSVPVRVANELLQAGHHYLDVRTPEEFSEGHPSGAINIPYMYRVGSGMIKNESFVDEVSLHFWKDDEIVIGCQSGKRSMMAAEDLSAAGFYGITDVAGGYAAWTQNGLPSD